MTALMRHPAMMGGSDGIFTGSRPHPRGCGCFARYLGHYVREARTWTLEEAVQQLAAHPARRLGLGDRGLIRAGMAADVVVFDADRIGDRATYADGRQPGGGRGPRARQRGAGAGRRPAHARASRPRAPAHARASGAAGAAAAGAGPGSAARAPRRPPAGARRAGRDVELRPAPCREEPGQLEVAPEGRAPGGSGPRS